MKFSIYNFCSNFQFHIEGFQNVQILEWYLHTFLGSPTPSAKNVNSSHYVNVDPKIKSQKNEDSLSWKPMTYIGYICILGKVN